MHKSFFNKKTVVGIVFSLFAAFVILFSLNMGTNARYKGIGADFMPKIYGTILLFCSLIQFAGGIKQFLNERKKEAEKEPVIKDKSESNLKNVFLCFISIIAYFVLMNILGFVISSALFLFSLCILLLPRKVEINKKLLIEIGIFSVVLPLVAFIFFRKVVYTPLPIGKIFGA